MANWWEKHTRNRNDRRKKTTPSAINNSEGLYRDAERAAKDMVNLVKPGDKLLPWFYGSVTMLVAHTGEDLAKSFIKVVNWGWPSE